jgi:sec-independent protein translocase protein TatB
MLVVALVALIVVGPQKLPKMLRSLGEWTGKLRRITSEVRAQTGIDDILRAEGLSGGLNELRSIMLGDFVRGYHPSAAQPNHDPYSDGIEVDRSREYPPEGVDAYGALPEDLLLDEPARVPLAATSQPADKADPSA